MTGTAANVYVCKAGRSHLVRDMTKLDAEITEAVLARLERGDINLTDADVAPEAFAARAEVDRLRAKLAEAKAAWRADKLSAVGFGEMEADLMPRLRARPPNGRHDGPSCRARCSSCSTRGTCAPSGGPGALRVRSNAKNDTVRGMVEITVLTRPPWPADLRPEGREARLAGLTPGTPGRLGRRLRRGIPRLCYRKVGA